MSEVLSYLSEKSGPAAFFAIIALKLGEMIWNWFKKKNEVTDENISALKQSNKELKEALEKNTAAQAAMSVTMSKLELDLRRCFFAIKKISGEKWQDVVEEMRSISDLKF